jgi:hypothetical protein
MLGNSIFDVWASKYKEKKKNNITSFFFFLFSFFFIFITQKLKINKNPLLATKGRNGNVIKKDQVFSGSPESENSGKSFMLQVGH